MAAVTEVTEEYRCGYCWQEYLSMDDPRELPCGHVFCLSCLQEDLHRKNGVLDCPVCQQVYTTLDFSNLQKAKLATNEVEIIPVTQSKCDGVDCGPNLAVSFCVDCAEKACPEHEKSHKKHFGNKHRVIAISIYDESPENFKKAICETHKNEKLIKACKVCDLLICNECDRYNTSCHGDKRHDYQAFDKLEKGLEDDYLKLLREADVKLLDICKLEKETWGFLDSDSDERIRLVEEATKAKEAKIAYENLLFDKIIQRIKCDQDAPTAKVETFNSGLTQKREALEDMRTRARRLMRDGSVTEKIRQRKQIKEVMTQQLEADLGSCELEPYVLPPVESLLFEEKMNTMDPDNVSIIGCELATRKTCYDMDLLPSGLILCAGNRSLDVCDRTCKIVRTIFSREGDFTSIQVYKGHVYALLKEPKPSKVRRVIVFLQSTYEEVRRWELPDYGFVSMLAVSNDKVYVVDNVARKINVYTLEGEFIQAIGHAAFRNPVYMCALPSNGVLVADWSSEKVFKINTTDETIDDEFKVPAPRGVYCDKLGNWWVWSSKNRAMYLRSADGQKSKMLFSKAVKSKDIEYLCGFVSFEGKLFGAACGRGILRMDIDIETP